MTVVSQINPSPPELSTPFPHETAMAGGSVGGRVTTGVGVGSGVGVATGVGCAVASAVGPTVGSLGLDADGRVVGDPVGPTVGILAGLAVAVDPLGATGDGGESAGVSEGAVTTGRLGAAVPREGVVIGTMAERLGGGKGVGVGDASPTSAMLSKIPNTQVTATIATNGVRSRGTHGTGKQAKVARAAEGRPRVATAPD